MVVLLEEEELEAVLPPKRVTVLLEGVELEEILPPRRVSELLEEEELEAELPGPFLLVNDKFLFLLLDSGLSTPKPPCLIFKLSDKIFTDKARQTLPNLTINE